MEESRAWRVSLFVSQIYPAAVNFRHARSLRMDFAQPQANCASVFGRIMNSRLTHFPVIALTLLVAVAASAQTSVQLSSLTPGTEWTRLVANGDFQSQGPLIGNRHPNPTGWSGSGEMSADPGTNLVRADQGIVAKGYVGNGNPVGMLQRSVVLEPATVYVLSGYLWNLGPHRRQQPAFL